MANSPGGVEVGRVHIRAVPDTSRFAADLRKSLKRIEETVEVTVNVDGDLTKLRNAIRSYAQRSKRDQVELPVGADTSSASRTVTWWRARQRANAVEIPVQADLRRFRRDLGQVRRMLHSVGRGTAIGLTVAGLGGFGVAGIGATINGITQLAAALWSLAGVAGLIPGLMAGIAASLGTVLVGATGISAAFKALSSEQEGSGQAAVSMAKAQRTAARQVRDAQEGVVDAYRRVDEVAVRSARSVIAAERALADAQRDSRRAQLDLNRAREEAKDRLEDLALELEDAELSEREAELALARAKKHQLDTSRDRRASPLDLTGSAQAVQRAELQLRKIRDRNRDIREAAVEARKAGVEGADAVVAAQERAADAAQGVRDAEERLADSRADAARDQAAAQRGIADAQERLADAQLAMAEANESGAAGVDKVEAALANLSPSARALVETVWGLREAWKELRLDVQERLLRGIADSVARTAGSLLPTLRAGLGGIADELNTGTVAWLAWLGSEETLARFDQILGNTRDALAALEPAIRPFWDVVTKLTAESADFLPRLAEGFGTWISKISESLDGAISDGTFDSWVETGIEAAKQLGGVFYNVGSVLNGVFSASTEAGGGLLVSIEQITGRMAEWVQSDEGQEALVSFFTAVSELSAALWPVLATVATVIAKDLAPVLADFAVGMGPGVVTFFEALGEAFGELAPIAEPLGRAVGDFLVALTPMLPTLGQALAAVLPAVVALATEIADKLLPYIIRLFEWIEENPETFTKLVAVLWVAVTAVQALSAVVIPLATLFKALAPLLASTAGLIAVTVVAAIVHMVLWLDHVRGVLTGLWEYVWKPIWDFMWQAVEKAVGFIGASWETLKGGLTTAVQWVGEKVNGIVEFFTGLPEKIGSALSSVGDWIMGAFATAFNWVAEAWNNTLGGFEFSTPNVPGTDWGGVDIRIPTMNTIYVGPKNIGPEYWLASGGRVPGQGGWTADDVLARLSSDEFVVRSSAATAVGYDALEHINATGTLPHGGPVELGPRTLAALARLLKIELELDGVALGRAQSRTQKGLAF